MPDPWTDAAARLEITERVEARLRADARVRRVARFGSMASDPDIPDAYSDIDLDVFLEPPTTDLELARSIRQIVADVASIRAARTVWLPGFAYVEAVWFEGLPPYWHVDIRCRADAHEPDPAYGTKDDWATGYTHWMLAVKRVARAFAFLAEHREQVTGIPARLAIPAVVVDDLRAVLRAHHEQTEDIDGRDAFAGLCSEVDAVVLTPARTAP